MAKGRGRLPYLRWFTEDYLDDTFGLELHDHGAYLLMLALAWRRVDCDLPNDMKWLHRAMAQHVAGLTSQRFHATIPKLLKTYWQFDPQGCGGIGRWTNKRLQKERADAEQRSSSARDSIKQRWHGNQQDQPLSPYERNTSVILPRTIQEDISSTTDSVAGLIHNSQGKNGFDTGAPSEPSQPPRQPPNGHDDTSRTPMSPDQKLARFQQWLSSVVPGSWRTVQAAFDANNPDNRVALKACQTAAKTHGKGWPFNAPQ